MSEDDSGLIESAVLGDRDALVKLLSRHDERLHRTVSSWITRNLQSVLSAEDVLQDAFADVYRTIGSFRPAGDGSFYAWLRKIAKNRFLKAKRGLEARIRDGAKLGRPPAGGATSFVDLIGVIKGPESTPSRKIARVENQRAVQVALAGLKPHYRQALWLRYIEGLPVREIATKMDRTDHAVHMLCNRGLDALRVELGSVSKFLSWRG